MKAESIRPAAALDAYVDGRADWCYAAQVAAPVPADALSWARASFEGAPVPMRVFLVAGWVLLLLEGRPRSDARHVLGWPVAGTTPETVVLRRRSRLGISATLVFTAGDTTVTFASAMTYRSRLGRAVWCCVAPVHRWAVRFVLTHAARDAVRRR